MLNLILSGNIGCTVISFLLLINKLEESYMASLEYLLGSSGFIVKDRMSLRYIDTGCLSG
jgi:hypothetical protein